MPRGVCATRSPRSPAIAPRRPPRATSDSPRRSRARPRSKPAIRCRPMRCARCTPRSRAPRCPRTMCTAARPSYSCRGTSSSAALADVRLRVITGPTGAGKSALVHALAARVPLAVVSADSRQIYRGFDIGTAKPTAAERACIPHFGVDVVDPVTRYSAAAWAVDAAAWIDDARRAGREPVIVGGTGFYVRALTAPLFVEPSLDPDRRRTIAWHLRTLPLAEVRRWCTALDPERAGLGRAQLERAIEVALLTGVPLTRWHQIAPGAPPRRARYLVVDPGPALGEGIAARLDHMLDAGWIEE